MSEKRVLLLFIACAVAVVSLLMTALTPYKWAWVWDHVYHDFWPLDSSRIGPNILASAIQWVVVGLVLTFVYRPIKQWINRELDHVNAKIDHAINKNPNVAPLPEHLKGRPNKERK